MKSVQVYHDGTFVDYASDSEREIKAIHACFNYFFEASPGVDTGNSWSVISAKVESLDDVVDRAKFRQTASLFKDRDIGMAFVADMHHYRHRVGSVECMTSFHLPTRTTYFYREAEVSEHSYIRNLVREPFAAKYKRGGHLLMHASACTIAGRGIIMPGFKGAGKSTLLTHLLGHGANYVANDAVLCKRDAGNSIRLTAYPQCVRLSEETVANNDRLHRYFASSHTHPIIKNKVEFLPSLFDDLVPRHCLSFSSELAYVLMPALDLARTDYAIVPGTSVEALDILNQSMFYPYHHYVWSPHFEDLNDLASDQRVFDDIFGSRLSVYRLDYGILNDAAQRDLIEDVASMVGG